MEPASENPYLPPKAQVNPEPTPEGSYGVPPRPVPFEDLEREPAFWPRVVATFRLAFQDPVGFFERVPVTDALGAPWRFQLLLSLPALLLVLAVVALVFLVGWTVIAGGLGRSVAALGPAIGLGILGGIIVFWPLGVFLQMIVAGALMHLFLWMWGGTRQRVGALATLRATAYFWSIVMLCLLPLKVLGLIPLLGCLFSIANLAGTIVGLVFYGKGLVRMHRTEPWRVVMALLTPFLLLAILAFLAAIIFVVVMAAKVH